ncbi:ABC transporter permease [Clostridium sp. C105KSO13]|uniref:ABC transporter permease n=1 Tax=Clostridium sp. C105KSO13 TaxID=1776045 RepID=UPI00074069F7|nr:ABC transporter permease [Clostridium sp. C105KSO13]CUX17608.1 Inner membrane ABC transporter permease protein YjfF [Clostridium sp. C105KSO13]
MKKIKESAFWKSPAKVSIILFVILELITLYLQPNTLTLSWVSLKSEAALTLMFAAIGETFVLLVGGIDLSIAGVISIVSSFAAVYMKDNPVSILLVCIVSLAIGLGVGLFNGFIIQKLKVQPFIVTFCTWYICGGIAYLVLPKDGGEPAESFINALTYRFGGKISIALIIIIVCLLLWTWFRKTRLGITLYAVGNNAHAASLNGINVMKVNLFAYAVSGLFAAMCGLYRVAVTATGSPTAGESFFNQAIGAVVIGGTFLTGGVGGQYGTIIGVLVYKMINDLLVFLGASSYWSTLFQGMLLIIAVLLSTISEIVRERKEMTE